MLILLSTLAAVKGQFYKITDAQHADLGVVVQAVANNSISESGTGIYLNPDYQMIGNYSHVAGFVAALGLWSTDIVPIVIGNCVVYDGRNYVNLTGTWGTAPSADHVNWSLLPKSDTTGYVLESDEVRYDVILNAVIYRADKRGNEVDYFAAKTRKVSLDVFQWGRDTTALNKVKGLSIYDNRNSWAIHEGNFINDGTVDDITTSVDFGAFRKNAVQANGAIHAGNVKGSLSFNFVSGYGSRINLGLEHFFGDVINNTVLEGSLIQLGVFTTGHSVTSNHVTGESNVIIGGSSGDFVDNVIESGGAFACNSVAVGVNIRRNFISDNTVNMLIALTDVIDNRIEKGFSSFVDTLDFSDGSVYALGVLTLPLNKRDYVGVWKCLNATGNNVSQIVGSQTNHPVVYSPDKTSLPNTLQFVFALIGVAAANDIVANYSVTTAGGTLLTAYATIVDSMTIYNESGINEAITKNVWQ